MDMNLILASIGVFLGIILLLVVILLVAKQYLTPSGKVKTSFYRTDFLGVMDEKKLPEWAQKGLEKAKEMHAQEKKPAKERGDAR